MPLVLLHGLLASLGNWQVVARRLALEHRVIALDLPHHGLSSHDGAVAYGDMVGQLCALLDELALPRVNLLGHSLGGKLAMLLALRHPGRVQRLIVEDIAPRAYPNRYQEFIEAMLAMDLGAISSRRDANRQLSAVVPEQALRHFLLTNLVHADGAWSWRANLRALCEGAERLGEFPATGMAAHAGPALFVYGEHSQYMSAADGQVVHSHFPHADMQCIAGAGHWVHSDQPGRFCAVVERFLSGYPSMPVVD